MRIAEVYWKRKLAGILKEESQTRYIFRYNDIYFADKASQAISLTLSKKQQTYVSNTLFPVFINMLSEGENKEVQSRLLKIDEDDYFGFLLKTAHSDTIGAITIKDISKK